MGLRSWVAATTSFEGDVVERAKLTVLARRDRKHRFLMPVNCAQLVGGGTALLLLLLLVRAGISFGTHGMPIRKAARARPPPPPAPTFGCAFGRASSRCPVPNAAATFVYIIITGQFYHRTRVKAMLEYVVPHLESVHIYSDVTAPEYCTTRLALPPALAAAVDNMTACRTKSRKRECAWRHAQSRWPLGLREAAKAKRLPSGSPCWTTTRFWSRRDSSGAHRLCFAPRGG